MKKAASASRAKPPWKTATKKPLPKPPRRKPPERIQSADGESRPRFFCFLEIRQGNVQPILILGHWYLVNIAKVTLCLSLHPKYQHRNAEWQEARTYAKCNHHEAVCPKPLLAHRKQRDGMNTKKCEAHQHYSEFI